MATFNEQMVQAIQAKLLALGGVQETGSDGEKTVLRDLKAELVWWERRVALEQGKRPIVASIDMSGS